jgi:hypothetical protein
MNQCIRAKPSGQGMNAPGQQVHAPGPGMNDQCIRAGSTPLLDTQHAARSIASKNGFCCIKTLHKKTVMETMIETQSMVA